MTLLAKSEKWRDKTAKLFYLPDSPSVLYRLDPFPSLPIPYAPLLFLYIALFYFFFFLSPRGTSGIDIDLQKVDIDQCPQREGEEFNHFAGTHKCKLETTKVMRGRLKLKDLYRC